MSARIQFLAGVLLGPFLAATPAFAEVIELRPGVTRTVPIAVSDTAHLADGAVAEIVDQGDHLLLRGKAPGTTQLVVGPKTYTLLVVSGAARTGLAYFQDLARDLRGLRVELGPGRTIISGELLRARDWQALVETARAHNLVFEMRATLHPLARQDARAYLSAELRAAGLSASLLRLEKFPRVDLDPQGESLRSAFMGALAPLGLRISTAPGPVSRANIAINVAFASLTEDGVSALGLQWENLNGMTVIPALKWSDLRGRLLLAQNQGSGRALSSTQLLTRLGQAAQFQAGGEIPVRSSTRYSEKVIWKRYGLQIKITPEAVQLNDIDLKLDFENLTLDGGASVGEAPGFRTKSFQTRVDVPLERVLMIANLLETSSGEARQNALGTDLPGLDLPFRARARRSSQERFALFIEPRWQAKGPDDESRF